MLPSFLAAATFALGYSALALPTDPLFNTSAISGRSCGSTPSAEFIALAEAHFSQHRVTPDSNAGEVGKAISVYFHVIYKSTSCVFGYIFSMMGLNAATYCHYLHFSTFPYIGISGGYLPLSQVTSQMKRLNDDFAGSGYSFNLISTTRSFNPDWFDKAGPGSPQQTAMKTTLRVGGAAALNIYSVGFVSGSGAGLLGYATFPWSYSTAPKDDGIVFLYSSVPGGTAAPYNLGRTLTHEIGRKYLRSSIVYFHKLDLQVLTSRT